MDLAGKHCCAFGILSKKRCSSFPLMGSEGWVDLEKPHILGTKPARSISLASKVSDHQRGRPQPEPGIRIPDGFTVPETDDYNSDEEDRRNGVPITYAQDEGGPFRESMKWELEAEFNRLKLYGEKLAATVHELEGGYQQLCEHLSATSTVEWTVSEEDEFLVLEDSFLNLREELCTVQDNMGHKHAQLCLFIDYTRPSSRRHHCVEGKGATFWSPDGAAGQRIRNCEYIQSNWGQVSCSVTRGVYKYEYFCGGHELDSHGTFVFSSRKQKLDQEKQ